MKSNPDQQERPSRFVVGFDLGTTNSAVCYVDTSESPWRVRTLAVPQLVAPGVVEARDSLPSFHYQPGAGEMAAGTLRLPWQQSPDTASLQKPGPQSPPRRRGKSAASVPTEGAESNYVVGALARDQGSLAPGRMISSAKSWLCHSGVDRTAALLPWHPAPDVDRFSPVEVSARYIAHVRDAWNAKFPRHPLAEHDFVLTLPASFDEIARELTVKAAALAGLPRVVLIEEPQAAFYAWIEAHRHDWDSLVQPGQKILVCDLGGGTSDFTLIRVRRGEQGKVQFHRVAVGDHLILGGDNMDLALAHYVEQKLLNPASSAQAEPATAVESPPSSQRRLEPRQWSMLVGICRQTKETMLGAAPPERITITLPGSGARLIGGALNVEIPREEVKQVLLDGFFPRCRLDDRPAARRSGFQEFGLPYAPDAAVTRYLAAFLTAHRHVAMDADETPPHDPARPDIVLFNGGVFEAAAIQQRLLEVLTRWFQDEGASAASQTWSPIVLDNERLDLAVARGAAYYGMVRRGQGVRIAAGLARTYYLGVEKEAAAISREAMTGDGAATQESTGAAVCLLPAGIEPGQDIELASPSFVLRVSEPVEFPLFFSSTRLTDRPGDIVLFDREKMTPLPPIRTVLQTRRRGQADAIQVRLHARLTEIGTLDLWCAAVEGRQTWRLQFDVRSATQTDIAAHESAAEQEGLIDESTWEACRDLIHQTFGHSGKAGPEGLVKRLAAATGMNRNAWPTSLCRRIWEALMDEESGRRRSPVHEARWLNLLGFGLRPGYGLAIDDWRVAETWRALHGKFAHSTPMCRAEGWILWRRIAGGLGDGPHLAIAEPLLGPVRSLYSQLVKGQSRGGDFTFSTSETGEIWRLLGSLELLPLGMKIELGNMLVEMLPKRKMEPVRPAILWAIGRIGARVPLYGPLNAVVPAEVAGDWLARLIDSGSGEPAAWLAAMQIARRTDDRYRDLPEKQRAVAMAWFDRENAPAHYTELVRTGGTLDIEEQKQVFGESLPKGLRLA